MARLLQGKEIYLPNAYLQRLAFEIVGALRSNGDDMQKNQSLPHVLSSIPTDLPIPVDDGACQHLENMLMPDVSLSSTDDKRINLSQLAGWNVIFCYPMTGCPGLAIPEGWVQIPGAAGCTPQVCSYRERHAEFKRIV